MEHVEHREKREGFLRQQSELHQSHTFQVSRLQLNRYLELLLEFQKGVIGVMVDLQSHSAFAGSICWKTSIERRP